MAPEQPTGEFRRADAERNAQRIVEATARLLAEDPHAGMAAIAEAAGVTRVTVNRHFQTREKLVVAVFERMLVRAAEVLRQCRLDEGPAAEALERLVHGWLSDPSLLLPVHVLDRGFADLPPEVREQHVDHELGEPLLALLERGRASGEFGDAPAVWMARLFGATLRAAMASIDDGTLARDAAPDLVTRSLLRGLRA
jgi:AcrR family transcriptional regulator